MTIEFSAKQIEAIKNSINKRWDFKVGATRAGKTTLDYIFTIPDALQRLKNKKGLNFICGVTQGAIERNILEPMADFWGSKLVSEIKKTKTGQNVVYIFGEMCYLFGGEKIDAIRKMRGAEAKFIYGDEVADWNEDFFNFIKSRLSLPYSEFHGACNPQDQNHFLYKFLQTIKDDDNTFVQHYTIFDNPFLAPEVVKALCKEYAGTIYYDRYILGKWVRAEGIIYRLLADNPNAYITDEIPNNLMFINIGVDFGGNKSKHSFTATGFTFGFKKVIILESERIETDLTPTQLEERFIAFVNRIKNVYNVPIKSAYLDSAEQVLIKGFKSACLYSNTAVNIKNALKNEINDRIRLIIRLLGAGRLFWTSKSLTSLDAFKTAVWDDKAVNKDVRLDDGTIDIDSIDSTEYSIEPEKNNLLLTLGGK